VSERETWERHPNFGGIASMLLHIHDSFRATSSRLVALSNEPSAAEEMRRLFSPLAATLHHHHHAEEQMLFPLVKKQTGVHPANLEEEHVTLMKRLDEVAVALGAETYDLTDLVRALDVELRDHLAREETLAIPVLLELTREDAMRILYGMG
jgi:iron-sulfur cluster repair protein YtfE (RIC family)